MFIFATLGAKWVSFLHLSIKISVIVGYQSLCFVMYSKRKGLPCRFLAHLGPKAEKEGIPDEGFVLGGVVSKRERE